MWASLAREWYAYYRIKEKFKEKNIPAQVTRNDSLDTFKGIDVYIENKKSPDKSIKLDILQETQRAKQFRAIKDDHRVKDREVPGIKIKILLGSGNKNTLNVPDFDGNDWYLIADSEIENIIQKFNEINS